MSDQQHGDAEPAIAVTSLTKQFTTGHGRNRHRVQALGDVSISVPAGQCLAVVGESGSGKTTLARTVVGLERADSGTVILNGELIRPQSSRKQRHLRARQVQMVFQDPQGSLNRRLPVKVAVDEVLRAHFSLSAAQRAARARELFDQVGLSVGLLESLPVELSGGQRQRVVIARALAARASILVLDEAVAALDVSVQAQILNLLADLRKTESLTYLFISHDLSVVRQVADQIAVMRKGVIVERGQVDQVLDDPQHPYTQLLRECAPRAGWVPQRGLIAALDRKVSS